LEDVGAGLGVRPVIEVVTVRKLERVVIALDLIDRQSVVPRIEQRRLRAAVVLDVALAADERPHLLPCGIDVWIVRRRAIAATPALDALEMRNGGGAGRQRLNAANETRARDAQFHAARIVTIDAADRMCALDVLKGSPAGHWIGRTGLDD